MGWYKEKTPVPAQPCHAMYLMTRYRWECMLFEARVALGGLLEFWSFFLFTSLSFFIFSGYLFALLNSLLKYSSPMKPSVKRAVKTALPGLPSLRFFLSAAVQCRCHQDFISLACFYLFIFLKLASCCVTWLARQMHSVAKCGLRLVAVFLSRPF